MSRYIIIMYTDITGEEQIAKVSNLLKSFEDIDEWTIDFLDSDKVLRISSKSQVEEKISFSLDQIGIKALPVAIFPY
ncbi:hypothetical protein ASU31_00615 [Pedobacter ginsenosidimutans]|uniref:Uncharacterized protein n=1 Tax=Pedobacter ginsenosidimutans TaxID=687842 RepID=A0A0T5VW13_9SPHI|nr:hypothetical protein [Pedobacter ginsenosidimutans]KRT17833.1 hypothetical protein ASU31_00615 [Pedobacter ginsenosidimutans]